MKKEFWFISICLLLVHASNLYGQSAAYVEGIQMPAWLDRDGTTVPARAGMSLQSGDNIRTGSGSRLLLRLEEGSHVKLGEKASIKLDKLSAPSRSDGVFSGFLDVLKGAFRFTTSVTGTSRRRNIDVRFGTFTAGIRGTDIWGRSANDKDLVCLLEGTIQIQSGDDQFTMSDPLTFYVKPKNAPADPVGPVDADKLTQWASETELHPGTGVLKETGSYFINLMSISEQTLAQINLENFSEAGYAVDMEEAMVEGKTWYRLRINQLETSEDAQSLARHMQQQFSLSSVWIDKKS